jgi:hypothetical protein
VKVRQTFSWLLSQPRKALKERVSWRTPGLAHALKRFSANPEIVLNGRSETKTGGMDNDRKDALLAYARDIKRELYFSGV